MIILGFDCSGHGCGAGICNAATKDFVILRDEEPRRQAERLVPLIQDVMSQASLTWQDITHITTPRGPGSFTGLRIALSVAKSLRLSLQKPVSTPDAFAVHAQAQNIQTKSLILIDTLRRDFYGQVTQPDGTAFEPARIYQKTEIETTTTPIIHAADIDIQALLNLAHAGFVETADIAPFYLREAEVSQPKNPIAVRSDLF